MDATLTWKLTAFVLISATIILLPWGIVWLTYWWPRWRYRRAPAESCVAKAVYVHDAMPYLHNRWGEPVDPLLPYSLYYATFKPEGQRVMKFRVSQEDYYRISQGDVGVLTWCGKLFVSFEKTSEK